MATIEIIIRDDKGNVLRQDKPLTYNINLGTERFTDIEGAVEEGRLRSVPEITKFLLEQAQSKFIQEKKTTQISI